MSMNNFQYQCVTFFEKAMHYKKQILMVAVAAVGLVVCYVGYGQYRKYAMISAHKEFVSAMRVFDAPLKDDGRKVRLQDLVFATAEEKWNRVNEAFERGYNNHKNSGLAGMFLAYRAQALLHLGKIDEAATLLRQAVLCMSGAELIQGYTLKLALVEMDAQDSSMQKAGLDRLTAIAQDEKNLFNDAALYHLGLKYFVEKNFQEAKNYFAQLKVKYGAEQDADKVSVWAQRAIDKLKLME